MHTYYTYESPIYKKLCSLSDFMSRDKKYSYSQKSVQLFRVSFFCICFPRKVSNIWDSICLVFPLSAKNKASYVGKHWVENWLYSRSHREKKKKDTHCFYRHGCFLITTLPRYTCYILLEVLKFKC